MINIDEYTKFVIDRESLIIYPTILDTFEDAIFYIPRSVLLAAYEYIKTACSGDKQQEVKRNLNYYKNIISFIKNNTKIFTENVLQTDELVYNAEKKLYIVVVNDSKNIALINERLISTDINTYVNDVIYTALIEDATLVTMSNEVLDWKEALQLEISILDGRSLLV